MITINGSRYSGTNISVINGKVIVDGVEVTPDDKAIYIKVEGDIELLKVDVCDELSIKGDVGNASSVSGDMCISGNVTGNVSNVSGDVYCGTVTGSVSTVSGDIG